MSRKNGFVFQFLYVIAWIVFIGLCIETGVLLFNYIRVLIYPDQGVITIGNYNLNSIRDQNGVHYYSLFHFGLAVNALKAYLFYMIIKLMDKLDIIKPFSQEIATRIRNISNHTFAIGIVSVIAHQYARHLHHRDFDIEFGTFKADANAFLVMAGVIFVIAKIFERGLELQSDNDLTI